MKLTLIGILAGAMTMSCLAAPPVVLETARFRYTISATGANEAFADLARGTDYLGPNAGTPCAVARVQGQDHAASAASLVGDRLSLRFGDSGVAVVLRVESRPHFVRLIVDSVSGGEPEVLTFLNVPLTLQGRPQESFGACALSLNLRTRVDQLPALQTHLRASCYRKFGILGAAVAVVGAPVDRMLETLREVLTEADEMPRCQVAGPWAMEIPFNHGSYLFNFGALVETNVTDWIEMAHSLGLNQIDNHGGGAGFFRFGDFELNRKKWPEGWNAYSRIVERLHDAGIDSILHTYAFFIDKQSRYVTPVPDRRLDAFRTFTLARDLARDADALTVNEPTRGLSTITGFFEHNSVVLHLGDELVTFSGVTQEEPWQFTGLKRGAFGTQASAHAAASPARHLKECFGLFVPDVESTLFEEIAANHADIVNRCGFDGIYLDAIDGSSILRGADECWYWADKFVFEIQKRLQKPVGMEMSAMWHHFWQYRTRWQAWDYPQRGHKRFVDLHAQEINGGLLLPLHLGWWNFQSFNPPQIEPTYPDVMEHLGARLIGWDAGISLTGAVDRERLRDVPLFQRAVQVLRSCEELRRSGRISEATRARLRDPAREFCLASGSDGRPCFREVRTAAHTIALAEDWTRAWTLTNPFAGQPLRMRIECLMSAGMPADTNAVPLARLCAPHTSAWQQATAAGVGVAVADAATEALPNGVFLSATNSGRVPQNAAWARLQRKFEPPLNLKERQALGCWVEGDGSGALLAIRMESPHHLAFGAIADRYLPLDFTGRRYVTLVETESTRWNDYVWNDGKGAYNVHRETIDFAAVETVSVWLQNLPPDRQVRCGLGEISALPMVAGVVKELEITVNGEACVLPVEIASGGWLECRGPEDCVVYGAKGETLGRVVPRGRYPELRAGVNDVRLSGTGAGSPPLRLRVAAFCEGDLL